ncbi:MAG: amidohydrolase family protein [Acidobacteriia bacterium]|nr:amidohydrolase family protein [Terriglobia bacterium]
MPAQPIDPLEGPKTALSGRVVTMDAARRVFPDGVVYLEKGAIVAVTDRAAPAPDGFADVKMINTGGTIYPGLIELHNHLSYNALPMWSVPKRYTNRNQWAGIPEYRKLISGPMQVLGKTAGLLPAVVRYVESKCLLGGVTTSQGIELFSNAGSRRYYRGIVRNVEQTDQADLPEAATKIADVDASDIDSFYHRLLRQSCFLLHLSEGRDSAAREHFLALRKPDNTWAITDALAGIHCAGLQSEDFSVLGEHEGAMIWSPLSNLLLYGETAEVSAAKSAGITMGLGSDWAPSGSKNLFGELKVARIMSQHLNGLFSDREIVEMATVNAASILKWENVIGSLKEGMRADLLVTAGASGDPYEALLKSSENDIQLVVINGIARYGTPDLMGKCGATGESVNVGGTARQVFLDQKTGDPAVGKISLGDARATLEDALSRLPDLARELEKPTAPSAAPLGLTAHRETVGWSLVLDEIEETGVEMRPRLPFLSHVHTGPDRVPLEMQTLHAAGATPLSAMLQPIKLDPLTVADDVNFLPTLLSQKNLPGFIVEGLKLAY